MHNLRHFQEYDKFNKLLQPKIMFRNMIQSLKLQAWCIHQGRLDDIFKVNTWLMFSQLEENMYNYCPRNEPSLSTVKYGY